MWPVLLIVSGFGFAGMIFVSLLLGLLAMSKIPGLLSDAMRVRMRRSEGRGDE